MDSHLLRFKPEQVYLVADTETEHLSTVYKNRPWQVGFILWRNGQILEKHEYHPWWSDLNVSPGAAAVTRFDSNTYKSKAEDAKKTLEKFEKYLLDPKYLCIFHNGFNFDVHVHQIWRQELGLKKDYSYLDRLIDTNCVAKLIKLGVKEIKQEERLLMMFKMSAFFKKGVKTSLTTLGKEHGIDVNYDELHNSTNDVILNGLVWEKLKWEIEI